MRALALLAFGLAGISVLVGADSYTDRGLAFSSPHLEYVIGALALIAAGLCAAYLAQKPQPATHQAPNTTH